MDSANGVRDSVYNGYANRRAGNTGVKSTAPLFPLPVGGETIQQRIAVLIAEPQRLLRIAIAHALSVVPDLHIVAAVGRGAEAQLRAAHTKPDVAVVAENLPPDGGVQAGRAIRASVASCRIIVVAASSSPETLIEVCREGFDGYISQTRSAEQLANAIRAAHRGEMALPREMLRPLVGTMLQDARRRQEADQMLRTLSARQRKVLALLVHGGSNASIAAELGISPETARTHIQHVLQRLGVNSRVQAVAYVLNAGLTQELLDAASKG